MNRYGRIAVNSFGRILRDSPLRSRSFGTPSYSLNSSAVRVKRVMRVKPPGFPAAAVLVAAKSFVS
jgi:hypothetical protein